MQSGALWAELRHPLGPRPRLRANGGPSVTPRQRTAHQVRTQHPPPFLARPPCAILARRGGGAATVPHAPPSSFARWLPPQPRLPHLLRMGRRVNGDASEGRMVGEAEWRGPPPLSRERGPPSRHVLGGFPYLPRVGFASPRLGAQAGDPQRRAKGTPSPPFAPCPR